ncbi:chromate transporter [Neisseria wadsworthii]|nr:chromate transporter [Neisseria wadsworthii]QMT34625.1 chromate transporter [Neisseria wadsworthii]
MSGNRKQINSLQTAATSGFAANIKLFLIFLYLGCTSFGGPAAHLGYFRQAFVENALG